VESVTNATGKAMEPNGGTDVSGLEHSGLKRNDQNLPMCAGIL
jgi:hypothetical protein